MPPSEISRPSTGNRLLDLLSREDIVRLRPHLESVSVAANHVIYDSCNTIKHVYFPLNCVVSLATHLEDGGAVEMATIGREGMLGLPVFLESETMPGRAFGQIPGDALRMTAAAFTAATGRNLPFVRVLNRYTQALFNQVAQTTACHRAHPVGQRCARWLLHTHDRVGSDQFQLTQESLSQMLGVRRSAVSAAAGMLQRETIIRYARGRISVLDRPRLELASCECYRIIKGEFDRLLK